MNDPMQTRSSQVADVVTSSKRIIAAHQRKFDAPPLKCDEFGSLFFWHVVVAAIIHLPCGPASEMVWTRLRNRLGNPRQPKAKEPDGVEIVEEALTASRETKSDAVDEQKALRAVMEILVAHGWPKDSSEACSRDLVKSLRKHLGL